MLCLKPNRPKNLGTEHKPYKNVKIRELRGRLASRAKRALCDNSSTAFTAKLSRNVEISALVVAFVQSRTERPKRLLLLLLLARSLIGALYALCAL